MQYEPDYLLVGGSIVFCQRDVGILKHYLFAPTDDDGDTWRYNSNTMKLVM